jgi:hypothetical protein
VVLSVAMTAWVYFRLTRVYFVSDDLANMLTIVNRGFWYFVFQPFGGHMLFLRNLLFGLTYEVFGLKAEAYDWSVFLTHLVNVVLVFRVTRALASSSVIGAFAATLWGASPLQEGALGWYSVYGQVVAATLYLYVLDRLVAEKEDADVPLRAALVWAGALVLGATCFGVGIAAALSAPVVVALLRPRAVRERVLRGVFLSLPPAVAGLYLGWRWIFFSFVEPAPFAEAVVFQLAFSDIMATFVMFGHLLAVGTSGLLRGFFFPIEMFHPAPAPLAALVVVYAAIIVAGFVVADSRTRLRLCAMLVFAAAIYGMIALGRANTYKMFGTAADVAARTGRYHYMGTVPLAMALGLSVAEIGRRARVPQLLPALSLAACLCLLAYSKAVSSWALDERESCRAYVTTALRDLVTTIDAQPANTDVYIPNTPLPVYVTVFMGYDAVPGPAALYALAYPTDELHGRRVHFVEEPDKKGMFADPKNHRLSKLLVASRG